MESRGDSALKHSAPFQDRMQSGREWSNSEQGSVMRTAGAAQTKLADQQTHLGLRGRRDMIQRPVLKYRANLIRPTSFRCSFSVLNSTNSHWAVCPPRPYERPPSASPPCSYHVYRPSPSARNCSPTPASTRPCLASARSRSCGGRSWRRAPGCLGGCLS